MTSTAELNELLTQEYATIPANKSVSTGELAETVLARIDPSRRSPKLVGLAAFLELKQLARAICRRRQEENEQVAESGNLFDFKLQTRYPQAHSSEESDVYLPLDLMTEADFNFNIQRLEREADAKNLHAKALRAERDARLRKAQTEVHT